MSHLLLSFLLSFCQVLALLCHPREGEDPKISFLSKHLMDPRLRGDDTI